MVKIMLLVLGANLVSPHLAGNKTNMIVDDGSTGFIHEGLKRFYMSGKD